uniref:Flocculation protein FLO11-like n=1 Tax=Heterorhabditis bacteriophora TaxID=37862 RepID=A0A1I7WCJ7_HETBA
MTSTNINLRCMSTSVKVDKGLLPKCTLFTRKLQTVDGMVSLKMTTVDGVASVASTAVPSNTTNSHDAFESSDAPRKEPMGIKRETTTSAGILEVGSLSNAPIHLQPTSATPQPEEIRLSTPQPSALPDSDNDKNRSDQSSTTKTVSTLTALRKQLQKTNYFKKKNERSDQYQTTMGIGVTSMAGLATTSSDRTTDEMIKILKDEKLVKMRYEVPGKFKIMRSRMKKNVMEDIFKEYSQMEALLGEDFVNILGKTENMDGTSEFKLDVIPITEIPEQTVDHVDYELPWM